MMAEYAVYRNKDSSDTVRYGITLSVGGFITRVIPDIGDDYDTIERLVQLFNDEDLDPVHLDQAVEDFLIDRMI